MTPYTIEHAVAWYGLTVADIGEPMLNEPGCWRLKRECVGSPGCRDDAHRWPGREGPLPHTLLFLGDGPDQLRAWQDACESKLADRVPPDVDGSTPVDAMTGCEDLQGDEISAWMREWKRSRAAKDFGRADAIRKALELHGVTIYQWKDVPHLVWCQYLDRLPTRSGRI